jgi:T5SS/PEP-CTERM-associated repeat protein
MKSVGCALVLLSAVALFIPVGYAQTFTTVDGGNETRVVGAGEVNDLSGLQLYVGKNTAGNALHILNGGKVYSAYGALGNTASSANNSAWIAGSGSVWSNSNNYAVGEGFSDGNHLLIELGGRFSVGLRLRIGAYCHNNSAIIRDVGSVLDAAGVDVGGSGDYNSLSILNGGKVIGASVEIGSNGSNNQLIISGAGSQSLGSYKLSVGDYSGGPSCTNNSILIEHGGEATADYGYIGLGNGSGWVNYNSLTVSGSNSTLTLSEAIQVGMYQAIGNRLLIENGASVNNTDAYIGSGYRTAVDNRVTVTGAGSTWTSSGGIFIGDLGGGATGVNSALYIEDSAAVIAKAVTVNGSWIQVNGSWTGGGRLVIADGFIAAEQIAIKSGYIALTNAVLQWTSQTNATPFMTLGASEYFSGTNEIRIAVSSRSAMENITLDLMSGLDDPADTNLFEVFFLDTAADQLYRPEGAVYAFETNSATWSITTDGNTEFVPTPPVPMLFINMSGGNVNIDARYLPEELPLYLQTSTNLVSGSWSNLHETSGTTSTNWVMPTPSESSYFYRLWPD